VSRTMPTERIPLNTLAIPFGVSGLAETWTFAGAYLDFSQWLSVALWSSAAVTWLWVLGAHIRRGAIVRIPLREQLAHPAQGPIAALGHVVFILLGVAIGPYSLITAQIIIGVGIVVAIVFAGWFIGKVLRGGIPVDAVHGGYFLPTAAGGYIASYASASLGWSGLAAGLFWFATLGWVVTFCLLTARLALRPALPDALVPTLAILVAPPAVGGLAWFEMHPHVIDTAQSFLGITLVVMLLAQLVLLGMYRRIRFTLGFWSFTFPFAAVGSYGIAWLTALNVPGGQVIAVLLALAVTVLVLTIALLSLRLVSAVPRGGTIAAEQKVTDDDDRAETKVMR